MYPEFPAMYCTIHNTKKEIHCEKWYFTEMSSSLLFKSSLKKLHVEVLSRWKNTACTASTTANCIVQEDAGGSG